MAPLKLLRQVFARDSKHAVEEYFLPLRALPALWSLWAELLSHRQLIRGIVEQVTHRHNSRTFAQPTDLIRLEKHIHMRVALLYGEIDSRFEKANLFLEQWAAMKRPKPNSPDILIYLSRYCTVAVRFYESLYSGGKYVRFGPKKKSMASGSITVHRDRESSEPLSESYRKYLESAAQEAHVLALAEYDRVVEVDEIDVSSRAKELGARHAADVGLDEEWKRLFE